MSTQDYPPQAQANGIRQGDATGYSRGYQQSHDQGMATGTLAGENTAHALYAGQALEAERALDAAHQAQQTAFASCSANPTATFAYCRTLSPPPGA